MAADQRSSVAVPPNSSLPHPLLGREDELINDEDDVCTVVVKHAGTLINPAFPRAEGGAIRPLRKRINPDTAGTNERPGSV